MTEEKFTPGPWHAEWKQHPILFPFVWKKGGHAVAKLCGKPINPEFPVLVEADFADPEKVKANAALITAAPDLYDALKEAVELYGKPGGPWNVPSEPGSWIEKAKRALKKARGE